MTIAVVVCHWLPLLFTHSIISSSVILGLCLACASFSLHAVVSGNAISSAIMVIKAVAAGNEKLPCNPGLYLSFMFCLWHHQRRDHCHRSRVTLSVYTHMQHQKREGGGSGASCIVNNSLPSK